MTAPSAIGRRSTLVFVLIGLVIAIGLAVFVAPWASSSPDGLERVASDEGFAAAADDHRLADGPLADYGVDGIDDDATATGVSGIVGIVVTFALGLVLFGALRLWRRTRFGGCDPASAEG